MCATWCCSPAIRSIVNRLSSDWRARVYPICYSLQDDTIRIYTSGVANAWRPSGSSSPGGIGELYNGIKDSGAKFIGSVETDGYTFDDSEAVIDGKFIGLPLDDINEDDKTDTRIEAWIAAIEPNL